MKLDIRLTLMLVLLSAGLTYFYTKPSSSTKTTEVEQTQKNVVTVVKETTDSKGNKIVETIITDKTKVIESKSTNIVVAKPNYLLGLGYGKDLSTKKDVYTLQLQKRVLPSLLAGVSINSEKQLGVLIGLEF